MLLPLVFEDHVYAVRCTYVWRERLTATQQHDMLDVMQIMPPLVDQIARKSIKIDRNPRHFYLTIKYQR